MKLNTRLITIAFSLIVAIGCFAGSPTSPVNCANLSHWSNTDPPINQTHVFCGEWSRNRPKGFHSRPSGVNPNTVDKFEITQPANRQGIYGGTWNYSGHSNPNKFSTMFPDRCTQTQVINSILYAANHKQSCPANAPNWAWCGINAPNTNADPYCNGDNGGLFTIAGAFLNDGKINTAFPLR
jgi:hypothetical protein